MTDEIAKNSLAEITVDRADTKSADRSRDRCLDEVQSTSYKTSHLQISDTGSTRAHLPSMAIGDNNCLPSNAAASLSRDGVQESRTSIMRTDFGSLDGTQKKSPYREDVPDINKAKEASKAEVSDYQKIKRLPQLDHGFKPDCSPELQDMGKASLSYIRSAPSDSDSDSVLVKGGGDLGKLDPPEIKDCDVKPAMSEKELDDLSKNIGDKLGDGRWRFGSEEDKAKLMKQLQDAEQRGQLALLIAKTNEELARKGSELHLDLKAELMQEPSMPEAGPSTTWKYCTINLTDETGRPVDSLSFHGHPTHHPGLLWR